MIKSMTGFGRGEYSEEGLRVVLEIKTVNHRYSDVNIRMPRSLNAFEDKVRKQVAAQLARGKVDIYINWQETGSGSKTVTVNKELALRYYNALQDLAAEVPAEFNVGIHQLALYPEVLQSETGAMDENEAWKKLLEALQRALERLNSMRQLEGEHIAADITSRVAMLENMTEKLEMRAPQIVSEYRERLIARMREALSALNTLPDEARVLQEAAIYAERINFTEELVRLVSHFKQFRLTLKNHGPVGKKLDFLVQEINRETNTIGSKCNDYETSAIVVEMKAEIEKIREQIQNIE